MKNQWKLIASIIILIGVVIFALQNTNMVKVDLFFVKYDVQLVVVMLLCLLLGVIIGLVGSISTISLSKKEKTQLTKEINALKENNLRDLADKDNELARLRNQINELTLVNNNTATVTEPVTEVVLPESSETNE